MPPLLKIIRIILTDKIMKDNKKRSKIRTIFKNAITELDMFGTEMDA